MMKRLTGIIGLSLALLAAGAARTAAAPAPDEKAKVTAEDIQKATKMLNEHLEKLNARGAVVTHISDEPVVKTFPSLIFYSVLFRQFPVAIEPPAPLKSQNIFVMKDGKLQHLTDSKGLEALFRDSLPICANENAMKDAVRSWLRLWQEFLQDGFYKFSIPDTSLTVEPEKDGKKVSGKAVVDQTRGDKGELTAAFVFSAAGRLSEIKGEGKVLPGIRPRCQATKLLDADPIIRAMAEQDILVMGQVAKAYLDEQRAKASPELKQAIDRIWKRIVDEDR